MEELDETLGNLKLISQPLPRISDSLVKGCFWTNTKLCLAVALILNAVESIGLGI